jgi:hypothetical protein
MHQATTTCSTVRGCTTVKLATAATIATQLDESTRCADRLGGAVGATFGNLGLPAVPVEGRVAARAGHHVVHIERIQHLVDGTGVARLRGGAVAQRGTGLRDVPHHLRPHSPQELQHRTGVLHVGQTQPLARPRRRRTTRRGRRLRAGSISGSTGTDCFSTARSESDQHSLSSMR